METQKDICFNNVVIAGRLALSSSYLLIFIPFYPAAASCCIMITTNDYQWQMYPYFNGGRFWLKNDSLNLMAGEH